jgi:hypothetical protein
MQNDNTSKILDGLKKKVDHIDKKQDGMIKEYKDIFKKLDAKITLILSIIEEFELLMDSAENNSDDFNEDEEDNLYKEWTPYDEAYESEDFENYDDDEEN